MLLDDIESSDSNINGYSSLGAAASSLGGKPKSFSRGQLSDLVRDLDLSKKWSEILASCLDEYGLLDSGTKINSTVTWMIC